MEEANPPALPEPTAPPKLSAQAARRLLSLARPHRVPLITAGLLMLISTALSLCLPLLARRSLDHVQATRNLRELDALAAGIIALVFLSSLIAYGQYLLVANAGNRIVMELRARLFAHLMRLPVAFFDRTRSGDLASHFSNDVTMVQATLTEDLTQLAGNLIRLVGGIALAVVIDAKLTAVVVALLVAVMGGFVVLGRALRRLTRHSLDALADALGAITEALANVRLVKAFAREARESERAQVKLEDVLRLSRKISLLEGGFSSLAVSGFTLVFVVVVWYGGRQSLAGHLTAGSLVAFMMTILIISGPMGTLAMQYSRLQRALGAAERLFALLDAPPEPPDAPDAGPFPQGAGRVCFDRVDFRYAPDAPVLRGLSLELPAGCVTAVVGASGAGKSTLAALLYRFYDMEAGQITIDGVPLQAIRRQDLREHIGLVPQEPILFSGTIRENIRYGKLDATNAEIEAAAQNANIADFIAGLTAGYETLLGERGVTLSGGQRQRVAIARALLKNPRILILDEATSALDTESEMLVKEALARLMRGRTTLVIAHRLTTVQNADQIAVLDAGAIVEIGTHDALLRSGGGVTRRCAACRNKILSRPDLPLLSLSLRWRVYRDKSPPFIHQGLLPSSPDATSRGRRTSKQLFCPA